MTAECLACFYAIQDIVWIRHLLKDIDLECTRPPKVFIDIQSARQLAMSPVHHQRSKHMNIKCYWLHVIVASKAIELIPVPMTEQSLDFLTKTHPL